MLPRSNNYCGKVILPICCCFPPFPICLLLLICIFYLTCSFLLPCRLSPEWDHLCPRFLGVIFHPSGTICAQNVRFYLEATIIVHGEVILPICCFPPFSQLFAFAYVFIWLVLFCLLVGFHPSGTICAQDILRSFFHANGTICARDTWGWFFTQVGPSVSKTFNSDFFRGDFLTEVRVRPFVPGAICARDFNRGDFLHPVTWDHLCSKRTN